MVSKANFTKKRVLVVDDSSYNLFVMKALLGEIQYFEVETAENGLIAIEICQVKDFDVIFMDLQMPVMDGFEVSIERHLVL